MARKELLTTLRQRLVLGLALAISMLLGIALYGGFVAYDQQQSAIDHLREEKRSEWLSQGDKHPHIAAHYGTFVFKPKTVLSLFDFGLDAFTGTSVYLEAHYQHDFMFRPAQDHSSMIRFGELSAALVLQVLVPLLIIFLAFSSFTAERERGTLKLLCAQGVSFGSMVWGKVLAYCGIVLVLLLPLVVGVAMVSVIIKDQAIISDVGSRVAGLAIAYPVYLFLWVSMSTWVSMKSATSRNALLVLLTGWMLMAILVPRTVTNLSESLYDLPSMREYKNAIQEGIANGLEGQTPSAQRAAELRLHYLKEYQVDAVQKLPFNFEGVSMQAGEDYGNKVYDHHLAALRNTFERQNRLPSVASLLNPVMAIQHLSMVMTGTDVYTYYNFKDQTEAYRRSLVRRMNRDMAENSKYGEFYEYKATAQLWEEVTEYNYQMPNIGSLLLAHYRLEMTSLILWALGIILLIARTHRKMLPVDE